MKKEFFMNYCKLLLTIPFKTEEAVKANITNIMESINNEANQMGINPYHSLNMGDAIYALAKQGNLDYQNMLHFAKADAAKDDDIKFWWNLNYMQRRLIIWTDSILFEEWQIFVIQSGKTPDQARNIVLCTSPYFSNYNAAFDMNDLDRPLPYELKERVDIYLEKYGVHNANVAADGYSSFNAYVREQIRKGLI